MSSKRKIQNIESALISIKEDTEAYFDLCIEEIGDLSSKIGKGKTRIPAVEEDFYWSKLSDSLQVKASKLRGRIVSTVKVVASMVPNSILLNTEDGEALSGYVKALIGGIRLRTGSFAGDPSGGLSPSFAKRGFNRIINRIQEIVELLDDQSERIPTPASSNLVSVEKNTAFIMMAMDKENKDLDDVKDAVQEIFMQYGIRAIRADDIEHGGVITRRVIEEIKKAQYLFADLTFERPNVYYEVGFAHALDKPVILYRKKNTGLHFDLAGYNCPEYENLGDLKKQLTNRLEHITGKAIVRGSGTGYFGPAA